MFAEIDSDKATHNLRMNHKLVVSGIKRSDPNSALLSLSDELVDDSNLTVRRILMDIKGKHNAYLFLSVDRALDGVRSNFSFGNRKLLMRLPSYRIYILFSC